MEEVQSKVPIRKRLLKWLTRFGGYFFFLVLVLLSVAFVSSLFEPKNYKQEDISEARANIDYLYGKVSDLESKIDDLESERNETKSVIDNISSQVSDLSSHVDALDDTITGFNGLKSKVSTLDGKVKDIELNMLFLKIK